MRFLFESRSQHLRSIERRIKIVDAKEQQQSVAGRRKVRTRERRMLVRIPLMQTDEDCSVVIDDPIKVVM